MKVSGVGLKHAAGEDGNEGVEDAGSFVMMRLFVLNLLISFLVEVEEVDDFGSSL